MGEQHSGYTISVNNPTKPGYQACLVIAPKCVKTANRDKAATMKRNLKHKKCVQVAYALLKKAGASEGLLEQIHGLAPELTHPITP